jgi:hypothetical protein
LQEIGFLFSAQMEPNWRCDGESAEPEPGIEEGKGQASGELKI